MSIVIGVALFLGAGVASAILAGHCIRWGTGPYDDAAEAREQAAALREHYKPGQKYRAAPLPRATVIPIRSRSAD
jgi:hypothetical protein